MLDLSGGRPRRRRTTARSGRGETSAGYHVSCLIDYAKAKTNEAIDLLERQHKVVEDFDEPWKLCPNCKQQYDGAVVCIQLVEAWLKHTSHLPESHFVRFRARCLYLDILSLLTSSNRYILSKHMETWEAMETQAKAILQTLEENSSELATSIFGSKAGDYHIEGLVAGESVKPLVALGNAKKNMGDVESAVVLFEKALEFIDAAEASGYWNEGNVQRDFIGIQLRLIKREMGLVSPSEEVTELRENLKQLIQKKAQEMHIAAAKQQLAAALMKTDPPQYFEAIKLMKEASAVATQQLGPEHEIAAIVKSTYDSMRTEYRLYLQKIAKKGNEQT